MNLLIVSSRPPWPPRMADAMTVDRLVRYLARQGHAVDLVSFAESAPRESPTGVGRAGQVALASLPGFTLPGDISATERYYADDVARPDFTLNKDDSTITVPGKPGLGINVDYERLARATIRHDAYKR